jgi:hypothetical protein
MLREDGHQLTSAPHSGGGGRVGHRWGTTEGKIGFHGGKVTVHRPRVRSFDGHEVALPSWTAAQAEDWLGRWARNLMLINVSRPTSRRQKNQVERNAKTSDLIPWSIQEMRRIAQRLARKRIQPADVVAWSLWRRAHQAAAQKSHLKQKSQL